MVGHTAFFCDNQGFELPPLDCFFPIFLVSAKSIDFKW